MSNSISSSASTSAPAVKRSSKKAKRPRARSEPASTGSLGTMRGLEITKVQKIVSAVTDFVNELRGPSPIDWTVISTRSGIPPQTCQLTWKYLAYGQIFGSENKSLVDPIDFPLPESDEEDMVINPEDLGRVRPRVLRIRKSYRSLPHVPSSGPLPGNSKHGSSTGPLSGAQAASSSSGPLPGNSKHGSSIGPLSGAQAASSTFERGDSPLAVLASVLSDPAPRS